MRNCKQKEEEQRISRQINISRLIENIDETLLLLGSTLKAAGDMDRVFNPLLDLSTPKCSYAVIISSQSPHAYVFNYTKRLSSIIENNGGE